MSRRLARVFALCLFVGLQSSAAAEAQPKPKPVRKSAPQKAATKKKGVQTQPPAEKEQKADEAPSADKSDEKPRTERTRGNAQAPDTQTQSSQPKGPDVVSVKEKEGVKSYQFGAIEVEGRLKSPQVIYFLRRVRAEFDAAHLGHRSFMRELSDTRRHPSLR